MATLHPLLRPYVPSSDDPFDAVKAAHLLNRTGFGGTPEEVARIVKLGPVKAVDELLDFPDATADEQSQTEVPNLSAIKDYPASYREIRTMVQGKSEEERKIILNKFMAANREAINATMHWWLERMAYGPRPLQEKLTLFWHGHFTTSAKDEKAASLIWNQNELLRRQAAGNFREFVRSISRDPAMLDYLNNSQNRKAKPNENYARELMELFTLGIGNYTENDIKEAARAFTGWAHDGDDFIFRKFDHDDGPKTFFGKRGTFDGDDVIDIILQHPACAAYISSRLFNFFGYENPEPELCQSMGVLMRDSKFELRPVLRAMFTSNAFYSKKAIGSQIKSPIQLVVGTIKLLGLEMPDPRMLYGSLQQMGQMPLMPPNVKGWPGGRLWINTSTLFVRYNTALYLAGGGQVVEGGGRGGKLAKAIGRFRNQENGPGRFDAKKYGSAEQTVDYWVARLIQRPIEPDKRSTLLQAVGNKVDDSETVRKMVQLILSMPEYQLC